MRLLLHILLALPPLVAVAQPDSLGQWRSLQSFSKGSYVAEGAEEIIYTTGNALFFLDKADLAFRRLTRVEGLTEGRINLVKYHAPTATTIIVYENSTIDLLHDGRFTTLREIDNFNFSGDKRIYDISFGEDNVVYLAAGYGVSALSLDENLFLFTTFTGVRVNAAAVYGNHIYAATPEGLYRVPRTGVNVNDFGNWTLLGVAAGLPGDYSTSAMEVWRGAVYFGVGNDIYRIGEGGADAGARLFHDAEVTSGNLRYLSGGPTLLIAGYRCTRSPFCSDQAVLGFDGDGGQPRDLSGCGFRTNIAVEDEQGRIFFGDEAEDVRYLLADGQCIRATYPGPRTDDNYRLLHDGTDLWVAADQLDENAGFIVGANGVYRLHEGSWERYSPRNVTAFQGADGRPGGDDDLATIIDVNYDPVNDIHYFSSFYEGLVARTGEGEFILYDERNSTIELTPAAGAGRIQVAGTATDAAGFTYVAVNQAASGSFLAVRSPEGEWSATGERCGLNIAFDIIADEQGYLWVLHRESGNGGITIIDPAGTPMDPSDDRCRTITSTNSNLPTNQVRSIALDQLGEVWVGTSEGVITFGCGDNAFDPELCRGLRRGVEAEDGFGDFLLANEEVRTIAVDGGNRKWIGTNSGAFLLSADGSEQLVRFDQGNSPLLDDIVKSIVIDSNTGTVYFGTELGIISFRSDATAAERLTFRPELKVFPNPVEPNYTGRIAIEGLARDARVKITDLSGKLVEEGLARGGTFTWEGTDYNGRRVTSGVYLIFASVNGRNQLENPNSAAGKIVFLR